MGNNYSILSSNISVDSMKYIKWDENEMTNIPLHIYSEEWFKFSFK